MVALLKPHKLPDDLRSYHPISLLCFLFKILKRLLLARLDPVIDPQLPEEQASFQQGHRTTQQIIKQISDIENNFERGNKGDVILVDLTAAYDSVWHQELKLYQKIPYKQMVRFLSNILENRSFGLKTSVGQSSRP